MFKAIGIWNWVKNSYELFFEFLNSWENSFACFELLIEFHLLRKRVVNLEIQPILIILRLKISRRVIDFQFQKILLILRLLTDFECFCKNSSLIFPSLLIQSAYLWKSRKHRVFLFNLFFVVRGLNWHNMTIFNLFILITTLEDDFLWSLLWVFELD